ncbi:MAG: hypothetical protein ACOYMD_10295 [Paludibacter sp.]
MARIKNFMQMTGSMAMVSMYTLQGHDQVIIRTKGGPNKYQIKTKPQFEKVRRNNSEWKGCTKMGSQIRWSFFVMNSLEDYPVTGALNAICKQIQKMDTESEHGKRAVLLSKHKEMLLGFSFSRKQVLESVLRVPIESNIDRLTGKAQIMIPAVNTDLYLYNFRKLPYYRIKACIGGVCDMHVSENCNDYEHAPYNYCHKEKGIFVSEWLPTSGTQPPMQLNLEYPISAENVDDEGKLRADTSLVLTLGIEFGKIGYGNITEPVKYAGTGKILRVG